MKVYSLLGFVDYEGSYLLGVFGSKEDMLKFVEGIERRVRYDGVEVYSDYDSLGYVESELGQEVDVYRDVVVM